MTQAKLNVMICASQKNHRHFIKCVQKICKEKKYSIIYAPYKPQGRLLKKFIDSLPDANIILMDVTPEELKDSKGKSYYLTNQGVLIEFGHIIALEEYYKLLYIFCENDKKGKTHPYVREETITDYSKSNLRGKILGKISDRIEKMPAEQIESRKIIKSFKEKVLRI